MSADNENLETRGSTRINWNRVEVGMSNSKKEPEFDRDGYPTERTLQVVTDWDFEDPKGLLEFVKDAWYWPEYARETRPGLYVFATGGWSGNESLLLALRESGVWLAQLSFHHVYLPGGLLVVAVGAGAGIEIRELHGAIRRWAWSGTATFLSFDKEHVGCDEA